MLSSVMREIHFARDNHTEFVLRDLFNTLRRFELSDFDAQTFIFQFELLSLFLRGDKCIATTRADPATNDDCHCEQCENYKEYTATRAEQMI